MEDKIPTTLEECFEIMKSWGGVDEIKKLTEEDTSCRLHHGTGMWLRNHWKFWSGEETPLKKFFHDLGIFHPDDMSGIIITSFHRHITGKPIELEEQVKGYIDYWKKAGYPEGNPSNESTKKA